MREVKEEIEFLEYIYQSVKMGQESVGRIGRINDLDEELTNILKDMLANYKKIAISAKGMLARRKKEAIDISVLSKMATYMNVKMNMAKINNNRELAQVLIQTAGVTTDQITEKLNDIKVKNKSVLNLATRYIDMENNNIEKLKLYLKEEK